MKLGLRKIKHEQTIDECLMTFEVINHTYVMLSKKLSKFLSVNQQLTCDKFIDLFKKQEQDRVKKIVKHNEQDQSPIFILKSNHIIKLIFNELSQTGYFIPIDELQAYIKKIENLEQTLKAKESFLYEMSHELKTPLQTMISSIDLLHTADLNDVQKDILYDMSLALDQAIHSTDNILNLAKLEQGKYTLNQELTNIKSLIDDMHRIFKTTLDQKNLYFRTTHYNDVSIITDQSLLKEILTNILSNAIKFTSEGGLYIETDVSFEKILKITIEDTGIGMTDEELNRLFKPFSQANEGISKTYGGTGLGLAITKSILNILKGEIQIESTYGTGTKIIITCPVELSDQELVSKETETQLPKQNIRVLIAEDNILSLKATKQLLENINLKVEVAKNGIEVINQFNDFPFDIILMDVSMPKMDGFDATKALREKDKNIPIIAMTANTYDDHVKACYHSGMTDILYKPFKAKALYQMISKHVK